MDNWLNFDADINYEEQAMEEQMRIKENLDLD